MQLNKEKSLNLNVYIFVLQEFPYLGSNGSLDVSVMNDVLLPGQEDRKHNHHRCGSNVCVCGGGGGGGVLGARTPKLQKEGKTSHTYYVQMRRISVLKDRHQWLAGISEKGRYPLA